MRCVIPCGGSGSRLGTDKNKCLTEVAGRPIIAHVIDFWRGIGIEDFVFIIGGNYADDLILGINRLGLKSFLIINRGSIVNLSGAIYLAKDHVGSRFILALGDCLNFGTFKRQDVGTFGIAVCEASESELRKNYLVTLENGLVTKLIEKPKTEKGLCGMGTYFLDRKIFDYMARLDFPPLATSVDLTGSIQLAIDSKEYVSPVYFEGTYINITTKQDIEYADRLLMGVRKD